MSNIKDRSGRRCTKYSDGGLNSGKSHISNGSATDAQVKALWDSSNHNNVGTASFSSSEMLPNNRELMKKYLADRNTKNMEVGIVPGLNKNDELRSSFKPSVKLVGGSTSINNGDPLDFEGLSNSNPFNLNPCKLALNGSGEGNHWPFSFSSKGPKTKREDQNAYRRELDRQIQHKKLIREKETEQLKKISRQKNEGHSSARSNKSTTLPWHSKSVEHTQSNSPREIKNRQHHSNPELQLQQLHDASLEQILFGNANNPNFTMPNPVGQVAHPNLNVSQPLYIPNGPQQHGQIMNPSMAHQGGPNFATIPTQTQIQPLFQHPQQQIGLVKDVNTGFVYQQIAPMQNQQQYYCPPQQQPVQNISQQPTSANNTMVMPQQQPRSSYPEENSFRIPEEQRDVRYQDISMSEINNETAREDPWDIMDNQNQHSKLPNEEYKAIPDYKPHVSESSSQRPESAVLRSNQKFILDKQIKEKKMFEQQRKAKEREEEQMLQLKIKLDQEKMQRELEEEMKLQKEMEEEKELRQEQAFQKQQQIRKEAEERIKREKGEKRKALLALADQESELNDTGDSKIQNEIKYELDDDRPILVRFKEASTQSSESSSQESVCLSCSTLSRGTPSSAASLHLIPEVEHPVEVEVEPLFVDFTTALALETDRMKKLLNSLDSRHKIRQI